MMGEFWEEDENDDLSKRKPGCDTKKPVKFLQRPESVLKAYRQYEEYSDESEDENKLLDGLLEEHKQEEFEVQEAQKATVEGS